MPPSPAAVHRALRTVSAPRLTWYADADERVELSGAVLTMWASKATGLLLEETSADEESDVVVDLPPGHWRAAYWCLGVGFAGGRAVVASDPRPDPPAPALVPARTGRWAPAVVVSDRIDTPYGRSDIVVTPATLARGGAAPADRIDEAAELPGQPDECDPSDASPAEWIVAAAPVSPPDRMDPPASRASSRILLPATLPAHVLWQQAVEAWARDVHVVVSPGRDPAVEDRIARDEGLHEG